MTDSASTPEREEVHRRLGELEAEIDRLEYEKEELRATLREDWDDE